ncbi:MAG: DNA repair protein RadC [Chloroflexota bacterium]
MDTPLFQVQSPYDLPKLRLLPLREQPAYRVAQNADACNLAELLAAIVGGQNQIEIADDLLRHFGGLRGLYQARVAEIGSVKGIGQQTAVRLKAALALGKKLNQDSVRNSGFAERPQIHSPSDAAALLQYEMSLLEQEYLKVLLLDTRNRLIEIVEVYHGSLNMTLVRVGEVFKPAVQRMAHGIILVHNHPSGDPSPSPDDIALTRAIVQAGQLMDIELLDHLIIGRTAPTGYVSLKEKGLGFS